MTARHARRASAALLAVALVTLLADFGATRPQERKPRKVAFLVGVSKYDHDFPELKFPERDVEELASVLRAGGFEVVLLNGTGGGATKAKIESRLKDLVAGGGDDAKRVRRGDTVFVALCGHGVQKEVTVGGRRREDAFFCPVNAKSNDPGTLVSLSWITDEVLAPCGSQNLLVVDACRSVADANRGRGIEGKEIALKGETAILFGCGHGEISFESEKAGGGHGLLTHAVLGGLRGRALQDKIVTWQSLVAHVTAAFKTDEFKALVPAGRTQTPVSASGQVRGIELLSDADVNRWWAARLGAGGPIDQVAAGVAERVKTVLDQQNLPSVVVGDFTPSARMLQGNGKTALKHAVTRELEKRGVRIDKNARFEVNGSFFYRVVPNPRPDPATVGQKAPLDEVRALRLPGTRDDHLADASQFRLDARMHDNDNDKVLDLKSVTVPWSSTDPRVAVFFGLTVANPDLPAPADVVTPPNAPAVPENSTASQPVVAIPGARPNIHGALTSPRAFVVGNEVRATADSPYGVEVHVKDAPAVRADPITPTVKDGLAFAPIKRGQFYEVVVSNRTTHMVAVTLTIDGLDQYTFSDLKDATGKPLYQYFLLRPGTVHAVKGWHRTNQRADAFLITEYAKSAAAERLVSADSVGTITATFAAAWEKGTPPPERENIEVVDGYLTRDLKVRLVADDIRDRRIAEEIRNRPAGSKVERIDTTAQLKMMVETVNATARGPGVKTDAQEMERPTLGRVREVVTVRYNRN